MRSLAHKLYVIKVATVSNDWLLLSTFPICDKMKYTEAPHIMLLLAKLTIIIIVAL